MTDSEELVQMFRSEYGRLCIIVARALSQGHNRTNVAEAARGTGGAVMPVYVRIRKQRVNVDQCLFLCKAAGVPLDKLVPIAREARRVAQGEWSVKIPLYSETP